MNFANKLRNVVSLYLERLYYHQARSSSTFFFLFGLFCFQETKINYCSRITTKLWRKHHVLSLQGDESIHGDAGCSVLSEEIRNRLKLSVVLGSVSKFFTDRMG